MSKLIAARLARHKYRPEPSFRSGDNYDCSSIIAMKSAFREYNDHNGVLED